MPSLNAKRLHIGPIIGAALALYLGFILVRTVKRNYELKNQITSLQNQIGQLQDEQAQLKYDIQYYQTDSYKDKEARAKLGLMAPGENVIILPKQPTAEAPKASMAKPKSNWQQWMDFLFGH